jgi:hypothetical protein
MALWVKTLESIQGCCIICTYAQNDTYRQAYAVSDNKEGGG